MGEHLSALSLDTLAAELSVDLPTSSHVATCAACRAKLDALKAERVAVLQAPQLNALLNKLPPAERVTPRWVPVLLAIAAALLVVVGSRFLAPKDDILKGGQTVELLKDGTTPVSSARVGDKLSIAVGGAGQSEVAVFTADSRGEVVLLVPSTQIAAGARVSVGSVFEVTPGSLTLYACFANHPLAVPLLRADLINRSSPPAGCVQTKLEVLP